MDVNKEEIQKTFRDLRPVCVKLTSVHTRENILELKKNVSEVDSNVLQVLQQYVLFPLQIVLKKCQNRRDEVYIESVDCISLVLEKSEIQSVPLFQDLFNTLCLLITVQNNVQEVQLSSVSEEMKIAVVNCLCRLIKSTATEILDEVYAAPFLPALGHAITVLLNIIKKEDNRQLRVLSMKCILELALINRKASMPLTVSSSKCFASFLPGISIAVSKVITGDSKAGHHVIVTAVEVWNRIVELVLADKNSSVESNNSKNKSNKLDDKYSSLLVVKDEKWIEITAGKLHVLTQKIKTVKDNPNWRIRLALVEWAGNLLNKCSKSLEPCVPDFLEVLISSVSDEYPNVARKSQQFLETFRNTDKNCSERLRYILNENLHELATQLPRLIRSADEDLKVSTIKLLNGYLKILGPDINSLLCSSSHLQHIAMGLIQVLELDCSSVKVIQERTQGEAFSRLDGELTYAPPKKYFKHFNDEGRFQHLTETCDTIGLYGDPEVIFDHFLELFYKSRLYRKQVILILNTISQGLLKRESNNPSEWNVLKSDVHNIIRGLLDVYLNPEYLNLQTTFSPELEPCDNFNFDMRIVSVQSNISMSTSMLEMNSNVLQICLLLEGIGYCVQILGKDNEYLMMNVLYPVLEKVGHDNTAISQTAAGTLRVVAQCYNHSSIHDLIKANSNYLVNAISLLMRHLYKNPQTPKVLSVILKYSDKEILPLLEDPVNEVIQALDNYYEDMGELLMRVLLSTTVAIRRWSTISEQDGGNEIQLKDTANNKTHTPNECSISDNVVLFITQHLHQKRIAEGEDVDNPQEGTNDPQTCENEMDCSDDVNNDEKQAPYHVVKLKQITERCVHLLSSSECKVRLLTLDTVSEALVALQPYENHLLPIVHQLWAPFIQRLKDREMVVILKACHVLQTFAQVSKDFIRQRTVKDVFPKMIDFLRRQAPVSLKAGPVYHHGMACKLQVVLLKQLGELSNLVGVGENNLTKIMHACVQYLSARQPKVLQEACMETFEKFLTIEPDTVWLILNQVYSPLSFQSLHSCFSNIVFKTATSPDEKNEFSDNVTKLLSLLK